MIETGTGNCHIFVDESADFDMAIDIIFNAKTQRIGVCNACESLVIHEKIVDAFLPRLKARLDEKHVQMRGDEKACAAAEGLVKATEEDWGREYLDYILSVKTVKNIDEAIAHINRYNTGHSEAIVTKDYANAQKFLNEIDAAAVYVNASTRFTDGYEFGFGAEIGISTQKLHARGPMGLDALTSWKIYYLWKWTDKMRVIAGTARSMPLKTVKGMDVRPTTDKTKETLFNVLQTDVPDSRFLDLFSGSGAIGIEALSRGASHAVLVEQDSKAADCILENLQFTKLIDRAELQKCDVLTALHRMEGQKPFDVIFMDPPYDQGLERQVVEYLTRSSLADEYTVIVIEASLETDFSWLEAAGFHAYKYKKYKTNQHVFIQRNDA